MLNNVKILIADNSADFSKRVASEFGAKDFIVNECESDGSAVIEAIRTSKPDIVICEGLMPSADAQEVIHRINGSTLKRPFFIVTLPYRNAYAESVIMSYPNAYVFIKPFEINNLISFAEHIVPNDAMNFEFNDNDGNDSEHDSAHIEVVVTDVIHTLGIPAHIKGYNYLREAIMLSLADPEMLESVTKLLYPAIAEMYDTSPSRVERAIRHAIETSWDRGDIDVLVKMFGNTVSSGRDKPTNSEFIALITDNLRLRFRISNKSNRKKVHLNYR